MLNVEGLSKIYRKGSFGKTKFNAVDNATFEIGNGEIISLIGESGSGKTTIGKMILKLSSISSGKIEFDGKDVSLLKGSEVKEYYRHVQGVFQDPFSSFNPIFKADRVFKMVKEEFFKDISASEWNGKLNSSLKKVGLNPNEVFGKFPHQLSGGQLQRLLIARALMLDVKLLVADEIISMLDASTRIDVLNLLAKLRENGLSVLFVTHDLSLGYYISDKSIILYKGVIVEMGKTEKVFQNPVHPYTRSLLEAVPRLDSKWDEIDYKYSHETREDIYIPGTTCGGFLLKEIENGHFAAVKKQRFTEVRRMNATIKDVAKNAGVSIATVSRVLNKSEKVSKNTREKILKAIVDTGYISTISQKEKTLKSIYVLLPENGYGFFDEFCYGIDEAACLRGYETIITTAGTGKHKGFRIFDGTSRIGATGIITLSPYAERKLHDSTEHKFPAVSIFPNGYLKSYEFTDGIDSPKTDSVGIYTVETANDVFARFASSGRKNIIVFFSEKTYMHEGDLKRAVNSSSFPEKGMRIKLVRLENASPFRAEEKMTEILKKRTCEFSAVFCTSDLMAAGIYRSFRNFSRSMPEEISVIGMGDHDFSPFLFPSLSTISMPKREMGKSAAELLMDKIETVSVNSGTYRNILFPSKLIIRDSLI